MKAAHQNRRYLLLLPMLAVGLWLAWSVGGGHTWDEARLEDTREQVSETLAPSPELLMPELALVASERAEFNEERAATEDSPQASLVPERGD